MSGTVLGELVEAARWRIWETRDRLRVYGDDPRAVEEAVGELELVLGHAQAIGCAPPPADAGPVAALLEQACADVRGLVGELRRHGWAV